MRARAGKAAGPPIRMTMWSRTGFLRSPPSARSQSAPTSRASGNGSATACCIMRPTCRPARAPGRSSDNIVSVVPIRRLRATWANGPRDLPGEFHRGTHAGQPGRVSPGQAARRRPASWAPEVGRRAANFGGDPMRRALEPMLRTAVESVRRQSFGRFTVSSRNIRISTFARRLPIAPAPSSSSRRCSPRTAGARRQCRPDWPLWKLSISRYWMTMIHG